MKRFLAGFPFRTWNFVEMAGLWAASVGAVVGRTVLEHDAPDAPTWIFGIYWALWLAPIAIQITPIIVLWPRKRKRDRMFYEALARGTRGLDLMVRALRLRKSHPAVAEMLYYVGEQIANQAHADMEAAMKEAP